MTNPTPSPMLEELARAACAAKGINPDLQSTGYGGVAIGLTNVVEVISEGGMKAWQQQVPIVLAILKRLQGDSAIDALALEISEREPSKHPGDVFRSILGRIIIGEQK